MKGYLAHSNKSNPVSPLSKIIPLRKWTLIIIFSAGLQNTALRRCDRLTMETPEATYTPPAVHCLRGTSSFVACPVMAVTACFPVHRGRLHRSSYPQPTTQHVLGAGHPQTQILPGSPSVGSLLGAVTVFRSRSSLWLPSRFILDRTLGLEKFVICPYTYS